MNSLFKQLAFNTKKKEISDMLSILVELKNNKKEWVQWKSKILNFTNNQTIVEVINLVHKTLLSELSKDTLLSTLSEKTKKRCLEIFFKNQNRTMDLVKLAQKLVKSLSKDSVDLYEYKDTSNELVIKSYMLNIQEIYNRTQNNETSTKKETFSLNNALQLKAAYERSQGYFKSNL